MLSAVTKDNKLFLNILIRFIVPPARIEQEVFLVKAKKRLHAVILVLAITSLLSCTVFAASGLSAWCIVPGINGSAYSEDSAVKETTGSSAYIYDATVGGGYEVDVRQYCSSNKVTGAWTRNLSTVNNAAYVEGTTRMLAGNTVCLQFSNDLTTLVDVEVNGTWNSN